MDILRIVNQIYRMLCCMRYRGDNFLDKSVKYGHIYMIWLEIVNTTSAFFEYLSSANLFLN
jgi:hypothetical protein